MVFRYFLGNMIREAAQGKLREVTEGAANAENIPDTCDVLVVMALSIEAGGFVDSLGEVAVLSGKGYTERFARLGDLQICILETGVGEVCAAKAVAETIALRRPQWVVSAGFAGGLHEDLHRGHFLMADAVVHESSGEALSVGMIMDDETLAASPHLHVGRLLTVDRLIRDPAEKRQLGESHNALACDMESFAVAQACTQLKTRFLSVRIISDTVEDELPVEISKLLHQKTTAAQLGAATAAIWNRPSSAKDMWKLKEDALQTSDRLAKFLLGVVKQLPVE